VVGLRRSGLGIGLMLRRTAVLRRSLNQHSGSRTDAPTPLHGFDGGVVHTPQEWRGIASGRPQSRGGAAHDRRDGPKQKFQFCQVFFEGGRAALVGVVCVVVTGMVLTKSSACIKYIACDEPVYHMHPTWLGVLRREGDWASGALPRGLEGFESPAALGITAPSQCVPPLWFSFWSKLELN
jgi:hypothetical protein